MPMIIATDTNGNTKEVNANVGDSVMEALANANVEGIEAICGGGCSCATCHVHIGADWLTAVGGRNDIEEQLVEASDFFDEAASRLSCQIEMTDALDGLQLTAQEPE